MKRLFLATPIVNLAESFIDEMRDSVTPEIGSVLYCDYMFGFAEHSGIYVGDDKIVHLSSEGLVEMVSPKRFVEGKTAMNILVSSSGTRAVGSEEVANRAINKLNESRSYNLILDNCHQFTAGCLTGDFENSDNFLMFLKDESKKVLGSDTWRHWDTKLF